LQILLDRTRAELGAAPVDMLCARNTALSIGIGLHDTRVDGKAFATNQAFGHAPLHHALEHMPEYIALAKAAMPVL